MDKTWYKICKFIITLAIMLVKNGTYALIVNSVKEAYQMSFGVTK